MNTLHSSYAEVGDWFIRWLRGILIGVPFALICIIGLCVAYYLVKREDKEKLRIETKKAYTENPNPVSL